VKGETSVFGGVLLEKGRRGVTQALKYIIWREKWSPYHPMLGNYSGGVLAVRLRIKAERKKLGEAAGVSGNLFSERCQGTAVMMQECVKRVD